MIPKVFCCGEKQSNPWTHYATTHQLRMTLRSPDMDYGIVVERDDVTKQFHCPFCNEGFAISDKLRRHATKSCPRSNHSRAPEQSLRRSGRVRTTPKANVVQERTTARRQKPTIVPVAYIGAPRSRKTRTLPKSTQVEVISIPDDDDITLVDIEKITTQPTPTPLNIDLQPSSSTLTPARPSVPSKSTASPFSTSSGSPVRSQVAFRPLDPNIPITSFLQGLAKPLDHLAVLFQNLGFTTIQDVDSIALDHEAWDEIKGELVSAGTTFHEWMIIKAGLKERARALRPVH